MTEIVTTFGQHQWSGHAAAMVDSAARLWPKSWRLHVYTGMTRPAGIPEHWTWNPEPTEAKTFFWVAPDEARGKVPRKNWRAKEVAAGYSYRTDAVRFCWKPYALDAFARSTSSETFFWLDADVLTVASPPEDLFEKLLPKLCDMSRLFRIGRHTETGWLGFRKPGAQQIIEEVISYYDSGDIYQLAEWHDAYLFDHVINEMSDIPFLIHDVVQSKVSDVFPVSPLGFYFKHMKGDRKLKLAQPGLKGF